MKLRMKINEHDNILMGNYSKRVMDFFSNNMLEMLPLNGYMTGYCSLEVIPDTECGGYLAKFRFYENPDVDYGIVTTEDFKTFTTADPFLADMLSCFIELEEFNCYKDLYELVAEEYWDVASFLSAVDDFFICSQMIETTSYEIKGRFSF